MSKHDYQALKEHILERSRAQIFETAAAEWIPEGRITLDDGNCPCGVDIKVHCYIRNKHTERVTHVGNCCIKKFSEMDFTAAIRGLKEIILEPRTPPSRALIAHAQSVGWITNEQAIGLRVARKGLKDYPSLEVFLEKHPSASFVIRLNQHILSHCTATSPEEARRRLHDIISR
jgi:hypothetical protein